MKLDQFNVRIEGDRCRNLRDLVVQNDNESIRQLQNNSSRHHHAKNFRPSSRGNQNTSEPDLKWLHCFYSYWKCQLCMPNSRGQLSNVFDGCLLIYEFRLFKAVRRCANLVDGLEIFWKMNSGFQKSALMQTKTSHLKSAVLVIGT